MKKCPFCAEEIQEEAIKCRYCGEFLDQQNKPVRLKKDHSKVAWCFKSSAVILAFLTVGPFALPLVWFHPEYSPTKKAVITGIVLILTYAILHAFVWALHSLYDYYQMIFHYG